MKRTIEIVRLGRVRYAEALALQERLVEERVRGERGDVVLFVEHPRVVTMGRGGHEENLLLTRETLAENGYDFAEIGRGGDVTYHGPGQLVVYPILDLKPDRQDVRRYVRDLEELMIRVCADYGVTAERSQGFNGTWVSDRKIGAVGVRISRWVTMHGIALNVTTALDDFRVIVPCGIANKTVTSLAHETGRHELTLGEVEERAARHLGDIFAAEIRFVARDELFAE